MDMCRVQKAICEIREGLGDVLKGLKMLEDAEHEICEGTQDIEKGLCDLEKVIFCRPE